MTPWQNFLPGSHHQPPPLVEGNNYPPYAVVFRKSIFTQHKGKYVKVGRGPSTTLKKILPFFGIINSILEAIPHVKILEPQK